MGKITNLKRVSKKENNLKVVDNNAVKTTAYSDINLKAWREYDHVKTDTLWEFPSRDREHGHSNEYHGNYIPQIAQQLVGWVKPNNKKLYKVRLYALF